jgi:DNA end-binding protein Ku
MAPRANWKGYLRLSLVSCPVALFPATSDREKVSFHQISRKTGHRVRMMRVDEETREEVPYEDIVKGYAVGDGQYVEVTAEELEAIAIESKRTIEIDEFVPKSEIDDLYNVRPYYIAPNGDVGMDAFVVIRDIIAAMKKVALGRVVLTSREHVIALEPRGKGLVGTLLRYPYEVRDENDYFADIDDVKIPKDMMELAEHIVKTKSGRFAPDRFEDRYEDALKDLLRKKQAGEKISPAKSAKPSNVVNLMDALRRSVEAERDEKPGPARRPPARRQTAKRGARSGARRKAS